MLAPLPTAAVEYIVYYCCLAGRRVHYCFVVGLLLSALTFFCGYPAGVSTFVVFNVFPFSSISSVIILMLPSIV